MIDVLVLVPATGQAQGKRTAQEQLAMSAAVVASSASRMSNQCSKPCDPPGLQDWSDREPPNNEARTVSQSKREARARARPHTRTHTLTCLERARAHAWARARGRHEQSMRAAPAHRLTTHVHGQVKREQRGGTAYGQLLKCGLPLAAGRVGFRCVRACTCVRACRCAVGQGQRDGL